MKEKSLNRAEWRKVIDKTQAIQNRLTKKAIAPGYR